MTNKVKRIKSNHWIQTYSGISYDYVNNNQEDINIIDIAHALSQQVRFTGHLQRPLSVAQHCLTVSAALSKDGFSKEVALQGLMHDAHEAYIGDINSPFKSYLLDVHDIPIHKIELPIKKAISQRFGIDIVNIPNAVKEYDLAVMRTEAESLFQRPVDNWTHKIEKRLNANIKTILGCVEAKELFIETFKKLGGKV